MNTEQVKAGIWTATSQEELDKHKASVAAAIERGEYNCSVSEWLDIQLSIKEVVANDFKRVLN